MLIIYSGVWCLRLILSSFRGGKMRGVRGERAQLGRDLQAEGGRRGLRGSLGARALRSSAARRGYSGPAGMATVRDGRSPRGRRRTPTGGGVSAAIGDYPLGVWNTKCRCAMIFSGYFKSLLVGAKSRACISFANCSAFLLLLCGVVGFLGSLDVIICAFEPV